MKISVVIPAYNEEDYIGPTLESLINKAGSDIYEIIVVDNASTDNTAKVAKSFKGVKVVREDRKGLTRARQAGLMAATGDLVAYIDADTQIKDRWFHHVKKEFEKNKRLVCLSAPYSVYDVSKWKRMLVWSYWNLLAYPTYMLLMKYMVLGANFVARRSVLLKIGGFDQTIEFYGEDTDIARRLNKVGKVKFLRKSLVTSSGRRMEAEGFVKIGAKYISNFLSEALLHRPINQNYKDYR
ncbi:MAG TPA: glycosyltransferase family 2 protein [Candidatus Saccharimonadales bacterium]|nr:glycosyltransferase family 2 protein [Candidatus Saccharimonadales bacterium]